MSSQTQSLKTKKIEVEPLVNLPVVIQIYGNKKTFWYDAKDNKGLPHYNVGGVKFRLSEVETWVQQRRKA